MFREHYNIPLVHVDASDRFIDALEGEADPEKKRKTIGRLFIEVFEEEAKKLGGADFLAQGTLYPDVIESVSFTGGPSVTIKSHHNVGGLPERMNMKLVEPLRELFKDEVRALGRELGLPDSFIGRHPFPGPGLAIRCPGGITREKLDILREADAIYLDEIRKAGLYDAIWQAFAVLLPVQTVGVMGDGRTYEFVCALRAVTSVDGMTADFYPYDMDFLGRAATRIINEVRGINRVVYDVTRSRPARSSGSRGRRRSVETEALSTPIFSVPPFACDQFPALLRDRLAGSELQAAAARRSEITVDDLVADLNMMLELARDNKNPSAGVPAIMGKAKLLGLVVDKAEINITSESNAGTQQ